MVNLNLKLPAMNGTIDVGISVGTDMGLPEADRIQIHDRAGVDVESAKMLTLRQVYDHCANTKQFGPSVCEMAVFAVYGALETGLISHVSNDVVKADFSAVVANRADELMLLPERPLRTQAAITLLVATKASWWPTNHHLGEQTGGKLCGGYLYKAIKQVVKEELMEQTRDICYMYGHSCSTRNVLRDCGIANVIHNAPVFATNCSISLTDDADLRFKSFPFSLQS